MKNPWMSLWLSEANRAASAGRGLMAAEMTRQQNALISAWTQQMTEMWMQFWFPYTTSRRKNGK